MYKKLGNMNVEFELELLVWTHIFPPSAHCRALETMIKPITVSIPNAKTLTPGIISY